MAGPDYVADLVRERDRDRFAASLYAPRAARGALLALTALDLEFAQVLATTTEALLGEIRLAWWRERLAALDSGPAPAQPVLVALAAEALPRGVTGRSLEPLEDAFLSLLIDARLEPAAAERYADGRGGTLFAAMAIALGGAPATARRLGLIWALGELLRMAPRASFPEPAILAALAGPVPAVRPALRPLAGLAALAHNDLARAAAGRPLAPRGTAGRQLRLLAAMLRGR